MRGEIARLLIFAIIFSSTVIITDTSSAKTTIFKSIFKKNSSKSSIDIYDLSIDENLASPELGKESDAIADFQLVQAKSLKKETQLEVETMRDGEIVVVTVPSSQLFEPNDTSLTELGKLTLKPFLRFLKTPGVYKMILAMHSDNTGDDGYTQRMTIGRVNSVYDWIAEGDASRVNYVVPYALGASEPLVPNNSMNNRKRNRRLEIYLVPGSQMIEQAKKGKIDF